MTLRSTRSIKLLQELSRHGGISQIILDYLEIPEFDLKSSSRAFMKYGWYIPASFPIKRIAEIDELFKSGNIESADQAIIEFMKSNVKEFEINLCSKHHKRKNILIEAFEAHNNGNYFSSIVLFLTQADGLANSTIFHKRKEGKKKLNKDVNPSDIGILFEDSPINQSTNEIGKRPDFFSKLNRHAVLHGISLDYNTEKNSLKALSLLCFVSDFYNRYQDKEKE
jgi:hypothetical protein